MDDEYAAALLGDNPGDNFTVGEPPVQGSLLAEGGVVSETEAPHVGETAPVAPEPAEPAHKARGARKAAQQQTSPAEASLADEAAGS